MLNPLSIDPFLDKFKNILFLNPFDNWSVLEGKPQRITFQESELLKLKVRLKRFSVFDWIQIIVAVAGVQRNKMEPSHNTRQIPFQIWGQYHQKFAFCIVFF